ARAYREVRTRAPEITDKVLAAAKERFGVATPFGGPTSSGMITLHCPPGQVHALASFLRGEGADSVTVADIDYVFTRANPLFAKLEAGLDGEALRVRTSPFGRNTTKCVIEKFTAKLTRIAIALAAHTGMNCAAITTVMVDAVTATRPEPTKPAKSLRRSRPPVSAENVVSEFIT